MAEIIYCKYCKRHSESGMCKVWSMFGTVMTEDTDFCSRAKKKNSKPLLEEARPDEDTISRKAAIEALGGDPVPYTEYEEGLHTMWENAKEALEALPPVQAKPLCADGCFCGWDSAECNERKTTALERYKDLCEFFGNDPDAIKTILESRDEFTSWLARMRWHVEECDRLAKELEDGKQKKKKEDSTGEAFLEKWEWIEGYQGRWYRKKFFCPTWETEIRMEAWDKKRCFGVSTILKDNEMPKFCPNCGKHFVIK